MEEDNIARQIRRMCNSGETLNEILKEFQFTEEQMTIVLREYYSRNVSFGIVEKLKENEKRINNQSKEIPKWKREHIYLPDTSYLRELNDTKLRELFTSKKIIVPSPVIGETDKIWRTQHEEYMRRLINRLIYENNVRIEIPSMEILLDPSWIRNPDYYIINVAVKLSKQGYIVKILTHDVNLKLKARAFKIGIGYFAFTQMTTIGELIKNKEENKKVEKPKTETPIKQVSKFDRPKITEDTKISLIDNIKILKGDEGYYLENTSDIDIVLNGWITVISNKGKIKNVISELEIPSYKVEVTDEILVFEVLDKKLFMTVGCANEKCTFKSKEKVEIENISSVPKKKYTNVVREAFIKLLKTVA